MYQNNSLQFFGHEEGRIRKAADGVTFVFDYFLKDHLGNVRMMLTEESKTDVYPTLDWEGTAGTQSVANQDAVWDNSTGGAVNVAGTRTAFNMGNGTTNGTYSKLIKKQSAGGAIGAAKLLKVMSGDQINTSVDYYWPSATVNNSHSDGIGTLTTSLLSVLLGTAGVSASVKGATTAVNTGLTADPNITAKITTPENSTSGSTQPKAYLHVLLFNEQFQFDNMNSYIVQIKNTPNVKDNLPASVTVKKNGYAYIYFSNESDNDVYFDNFKLTDVRGQILQESHYNPWGEKLSGISSQAMSFGGTTNRYLYNGKEQQAGEFSDGSGLEEYDYGARMYDDQLGRWNVVDPLADKSRRWSTYNYAYDNPIRFIDMDGMESQDANDDDRQVNYMDVMDKDGNVTRVWDYADDKDKDGNEPNTEESTGAEVGSVVSMNLFGATKVDKGESNTNSDASGTDDGGEQNGGYRKNGSEYQYRGGTVQNWSNDKNQRYAIFTDIKTAVQTIFPGASITNFGVGDNKGVTMANGGIHADNSFGLADLQHEYGHYLQALAYGATTYNLEIVPASFYSAATSTPQEHSNFWTEKDANAWATVFFGNNSAIGQSQYFPKEFSSLIFNK